MGKFKRVADRFEDDKGPSPEVICQGGDILNTSKRNDPSATDTCPPKVVINCKDVFPLAAVGFRC